MVQWPNSNIHPESDLAEEWVFGAASWGESKPLQGALQIQNQQFTSEGGQTPDAAAQGFWLRTKTDQGQAHLVCLWSGLLYERGQDGQGRREFLLYHPFSIFLYRLTVFWLHFTAFQ